MLFTHHCNICNKSFNSNNPKPLRCGKIQCKSTKWNIKPVNTKPVHEPKSAGKIDNSVDGIEEWVKDQFKNGKQPSAHTNMQNGKIVVYRGGKWFKTNLTIEEFSDMRRIIVHDNT